MFVLFLVLLQGCVSSGVGEASGISSGSGGSIATVAPIPETPQVTTEDQLPVTQNAEGNYTRQALSFFSRDSLSALGPQVVYTGTSN